jgi:hypothetical protein
MLSTEPSEESDLGPFSTGNGTEAEGGEEGESITAVLKWKSSSEIRVFYGIKSSETCEHLVEIVQYTPRKPSNG